MIFQLIFQIFISLFIIYLIHSFYNYIKQTYSTKKTAWLPRGSLDIYCREPYRHLQGRYYISERETQPPPPPTTLPVNVFPLLKVPKPKKLFVQPPSNSTNTIPSQRPSQRSTANSNRS